MTSHSAGNAAFRVHASQRVELTPRSKQKPGRFFKSGRPDAGEIAIESQNATLHSSIKKCRAPANQGRVTQRNSRGDSVSESATRLTEIFQPPRSTVSHRLSHAPMTAASRRLFAPNTACHAPQPSHRLPAKGTLIDADGNRRQPRTLCVAKDESWCSRLRTHQNQAIGPSMHCRCRLLGPSRQTLGHKGFSQT